MILDISIILIAFDVSHVEQVASQFRTDEHDLVQETSYELDMSFSTIVDTIGILEAVWIHGSSRLRTMLLSFGKSLTLLFDDAKNMLSDSDCSIALFATCVILAEVVAAPCNSFEQMNRKDYVCHLHERNVELDVAGES